MAARQTVEAFIAAINAHDVDAIVDLCSADHAFVDAHGNVTRGDDVEAAWRGYFGFMPRYGIEAESLLADRGVVAVFGTAWGALAGDGSATWRRPAAWRALVAAGKIQAWQVYVDTKIVFDLMANPQRTPPVPGVIPP
jgi:ketosteroid isomerase-like protein